MSNTTITKEQYQNYIIAQLRSAVEDFISDPTYANYSKADEWMRQLRKSR